MSMWMANKVNQVVGKGIGWNECSHEIRTCLLHVFANRRSRDVERKKGMKQESLEPLESNHCQTWIGSFCKQSSPVVKDHKDVQSFSRSAISHAVVLDTGCQRSAVGMKTLQEIARLLPDGLDIKLVEQSYKFNGVGGTTTTKFVACIPVCFGHRPGLIKAAILQDDAQEAPLLVSLPILRALGTDFSLKHNRVYYEDIDAQGHSFYNTKGQLCLELFDFSSLADVTFSQWKPKKVLGDECTLFFQTIEQHEPDVRREVVESSHDRPLHTQVDASCQTNENPSVPVKPSIPDCIGDPSRFSVVNNHGCRTCSKQTREDSTEFSNLVCRSMETVDEQTADSRVLDFTSETHGAFDVSTDVGANSSLHECTTTEHARPRGDGRDDNDTERVGATSEEGDVQEDAEGRAGEKGPTETIEETFETTIEAGDGRQREHAQLQPDHRCAISWQEQGKEEQGFEGYGHVINRSQPDSHLLLRNHSNSVHMSQGGTQLDAPVLPMQSSSKPTVPIFQVDWSGQIRSTVDDAASTFNASREHSDQQSIQLREGIQQLFRGQREQQRGVFFPNSCTNSYTQECHQEEGRAQEQRSQCRLGESVGYGQWLSSRLESSRNQCTSGETNVQDLRSDRDPSLQDRGNHSHHGPKDQGDQEQQQQLQAEEEQVSFQSVEGIRLESPVEQTIKSGVRKRILGELKGKIQELENEFIKEETHCQNDLPMIYHLKTIGEVFSVPRFTARAQQHGLQAGRAFDIELGDDFLDPKKRQKCIQHLRDEEYGLVTVSSPCTLFSNLQFLALGRSKSECFKDPVFMAKYKDALTLLTFGVTVCQLQHASNRYFLFEQPWSASSWKTIAVKRLINLPGVRIARTDQCAFGLSDPSGQLIKKRTGFATNSIFIARNLRKSCTGTHEHAYCLGSVKGISRATHASKYTNRLVDAVLRGFVQQLQHHSEEVPSHIFLSALCKTPSMNKLLPEELHVHYLLEYDTDSSTSYNEIELYHADLWMADQEDTDIEIQQDEDLEEVEPNRRRSLMQEIDKAHRGLGHPSKDRFLRILRAGKASSLIQALAKTYECSQCREEQRPRPWRRAAPPRELGFNEVVGVDTLTIKCQVHRIQCLNCICWGTRYQLIIPLKEGTAAHVREAYRQWIKLFGPPKVVKPDLGREFLQEFAYRCGTDGSTVDPSSLEAPTQAAITEREGKSFKMIFAKASIELGRSLSIEEIHELIDITCVTKNRLTHRSGYSAIHRVFGFTPCMPGEFLQGNDGNFMNASANIQGDIQLQLQEQMRLAAGRAFFSAECHDALKRAIASGHRKLDNFQIGQEVYFWSVGVHRKVSHPNSASRKPNNQMWHGPAHIIAVQHPSTVFLNYQGKLVKAAPEQCRMCSADETAACSELLSRLCHVRDRLQGQSVAGMFDITGQERPPDHENHPTGKKRTLGKQPPVRKRAHYQADRSIGVKRPFEFCTAHESIDLDPSDIDLDEPLEPMIQPEDEDMNLWLAQCWHVSLSSEDTDWFVEQCWNVSVSGKEQKGGKELRFKDLDAYDQQLFREAIMKEWTTNIEAGAISVLSPEASRNIRQRLPHRIMRSRLLLTAKPVEDESQLTQDKRVHCAPSGPCCKAKARWIARGDKDPDVFQVESSSPVIARDSFFLGLQIIASHKWRMHFADFSQAFMQGTKLKL